jgi:hypothetical protein
MLDVETGELRIALCKNNKRGEPELLPWIEAWVEKGTTITTDCWKAYGKLESLGYIHKTVNHSKEFVTKDGVHSNDVEAAWRPLKDHFRQLRIRSVCDDCQDKFYVAHFLYKEQVTDVETIYKDDEEELKARTKEYLKELQESYRTIRNERGNCEECKQHEQKFGYKITEYLWRREIKKQDLDPFEMLLSAFRHYFESAEDTNGQYEFYMG